MPDIKELPNTYWSDTEHYGLLGTPVRKSLSALMHNSNFQSMNMNAVYFPIDVDEAALSEVMPAFMHLKYRGLNVTMPLKSAVIPYLDEITDLGRLCEAVNTIRIENGKMYGTNTDATGFVHALRDQGGRDGQAYDPAGRACVLFGSGGAGRGVAFGLADAGVGRITIFDIEQSHRTLEQLVSKLNSTGNGLAEGHVMDTNIAASAIREADFVVNATSVGMTPNDDSTVFDTSLLEPRHTVCDVVYSPYRTKMLREAEAIGCRTVEGYWMLLWQGVDAFRFWTGQEPDVEIMTDVVVRSVTGAGSSGK